MDKYAEQRPSPKIRPKKKKKLGPWKYTNLRCKPRGKKAVQEILWTPINSISALKTPKDFQ